MVVNDMLLSARKLTSHIAKQLRGFTLIELLVVIGILGVLAAAALVAINPAEAQKKARDTQRLKDIATLQSIVEQYLNDNPGALTLTDGNSSGTNSNVCSSGWLKTALGAASLCTYVNVLPVDPLNRATTVTSSTGTDVANTNAYYYIRFSSGTYKICTYLESKSNAVKLTNDGETNTGGSSVFATFSAPAIACP